MRVKDKVIIVTGAGAGMGRAVALRFAQEQAKVVVAEINPSDGEEILEAIRREGGKAIFVRTDVASEREVQAMVGAAVEHYGRVDVLYNNAAVQLHGLDARAHELSSEAWERTMATNLRSVWLCSKYVIPEMLKLGKGSIINVASPTGLTGCAPGYTAYSTSKGGVFALTRVMAADYGRDNIRVNAIVPGPMETPMIADYVADESKRLALTNSTMLGRLGAADDVNGLAVFLASDESSYCTGGMYMADGGITAL